MATSNLKASVFVSIAKPEAAQLGIRSSKLLTASFRLLLLLFFYDLGDLLSALRVSKANFKLPVALNGRMKWIFHKISNERHTLGEFEFVEVGIYFFQMLKKAFGLNLQDKGNDLLMYG